MIKKLLTVSISLALIGASGLTMAEGATGKAKTATCAGCHGEDGNSMMPGFPKLAGQHAGYLVKQMQAFKSGARNSAMMAPMVLGLETQDMQDIANVYAANKISANAAPVFKDDDEDEDQPKTADQKKAEMDQMLSQGGDLFRNGSLTDGVSACIACHGSQAEGNKPASFPALRSQHAEYLIKTLTDYKTGARTSNKENMMLMIAKKMSDEQIKAVSHYISTLK